MPDTYTPSRLDQALFGPPFIVIDADNAAHTITHDLAEAVEILNTDGAARAIVGTLTPPMLAVDIDPADTGASPEAGEVVAEQLVLWAETYGLPWLRRDSGRPGHGHLVIQMPPSLRDELLVVVRVLAARQSVSATVRSTLRLTSSPHRDGLPGPIRTSTLIAADATRHPSARPAGTARTARRRRVVSRSRSEGEYGHALALARASYTTAHAWSFANLAGTKAREIGQAAWQRWFWAPATTIAAAENGLTEQQAWDLFNYASPTQAAHLGRDEWRRSRWQPALQEAAKSRPRRRRLGPHQVGENRREPSPCRLRQVRAALQRAVDRCLDRGLNVGTSAGPIVGVRVNSLRAALDALAHALVTTQGSISVREWAERARLDPKTVRRARDVALSLGILKRVHHYAGGGTDCDAFASIGETDSEPNKELTSPTLYTPTLGEADVLRLQRQHYQDRIQRKKILNKGPQRTFKGTKRPKCENWSTAVRLGMPTNTSFVTRKRPPTIRRFDPYRRKHALPWPCFTIGADMEDAPSPTENLTPSQRTMRARIAAHESWARTADRTERTAPARKAALDRFERLVDPNGELDETTRKQLADSAKRAHFQRLALLSSRARRRGSVNDK
jgi:hypothetical protein